MKVLVFGCFDLLHPGHIWFLKKARSLGNRLLVVLARDTQIKRIKGHAPNMNERDRLHVVKALAMVDEAYLGDPKYRYEHLVKKLQPDIIVLGYDQKETREEIQGKLATVGVYPKIMRLKACRPEIYKSSFLSSPRKRGSRPRFPPTRE